MTEKSTFSLARDKIEFILSIINKYLEGKIKVEIFIQFLFEDTYHSFDLISSLGSHIAELIYQFQDHRGLYLNINEKQYLSESELRFKVEQTNNKIICEMKLISGYYMSYTLFDSHREFIIQNIPNGKELLSKNEDELLDALYVLLVEHGYDSYSELTQFGRFIEKMYVEIYLIN